MENLWISKSILGIPPSKYRIIQEENSTYGVQEYINGGWKYMIGHFRDKETYSWAYNMCGYTTIKEAEEEFNKFKPKEVKTKKKEFKIIKYL